MLTFFTFVFFTAFVGVVTWLITRNKETESADGFFLAGRSLGAGVIAGSLLLTNLSTEQLVGLNGLAFKDGLCVMAWEVVAAMSLVVMAIFFLPRYLARGITTIPEFLEGRFDAQTRMITDGIFILAYMLILLPIVLYSGALGLREILDLKTLTGIESDTTLLWLSIWVIGIIGSIYAIFGGLRSVAVSDTINGCGLLIGGILISYLGLQYVGNGDWWSGLQTIKAAHPEKFRSLGDNDAQVPWHTLFSGVLLLNLFYWTTNQQIIQRTFAAKTLAHGQRGVLLAAFFKILAPLIVVLPGIIAFHVFHETDSEMVPDAAYGKLVRTVLPPVLNGFFAAVIVGAILSSFNSALNATATLFSTGIYRSHLRPNASDRETVYSSRIFGTIVALGAMSTAPLLEGQKTIFEYLQKMNGLYFIPIFAVVLVGLFTKRVPPLAAKLGLIIGLILIAAGYFVPGPKDWVSAYLYEFHFLGIVFVMLIVGMLLFPAQPSVSNEGSAAAMPSGKAALVKPPVDMTPWPLVVPAGLLLVSIVVGIYVWFALG